MWVSEGGQSSSWVWKLLKSIKITRADWGKKKFWDGKIKK